MSVICYTLNDFQDIANGTMNYILPASIKDTIGVLTSKFSSSTNNGGGSYERKGGGKYRSSSGGFSRGGFKKNEEPEEEFKPTVIKKLEGTEKLMNDIRSALNKMSTKNYDLNAANIIELLAELVEGKSEEAQDAIPKIATNIFEIASTNKFFSELYARLYKDISEKFPDVFQSILDGFLNGFTNTMEEIHYVDQEVDFDGFCEYNKKNDKRRATSMFITNLVKCSVLDPFILISIIQKIQETLKMYMEKEDSSNEVEETIENLFILITNNTEFLKNYITAEYLDTIIEVSKLKAKQMASVSSRAIFKAMDIIAKTVKSADV